MKDPRFSPGTGNGGGKIAPLAIKTRNSGGPFSTQNRIAGCTGVSSLTGTRPLVDLHETPISGVGKGCGPCKKKARLMGGRGRGTGSGAENRLLHAFLFTGRLSGNCHFKGTYMNIP